MTQDRAGPDTSCTEPADSGSIGSRKTGEAARKTLAMRIAHRNQLRAERLARLRGNPAPAGQAAQATSAAEGKPVAPMPASSPAEPAEQMKAAPAASADSSADTADDGTTALEDFLRGLSQSDPAASAFSGPESPPEPASVLPFQRPPELDAAAVGGTARAALLFEPRAAPVCDLHRLEGAGPGLIWALQRAGIACMAELAALEAPELASRLGYLGRLVPAQTWIATARAR
jgi:predicted flap endonuclease-1-like 5' DNA nuclease